VKLPQGLRNPTAIAVNEEEKMKATRAAFAPKYVSVIAIALSLLSLASRAFGQQGLTVGENSNVLCFDGKTWQPEAVPTAAIMIYSISRAKDTGEAWAVGAREDLGGGNFADNGSIFHRKAGACGVKWDDQTPLLKKNKIKTNADLYGVFALDSKHVWAVGEKGTILFYNGKAWSKPASNTAADLYTVYATGNSAAWAAGAPANGGKSPSVLYLDDKGMWQSSKTPPSVAATVRSILFQGNGQHGYLVGDSGLGVWTSDDGGLKWSLEYKSQANLNKIVLGTLFINEFRIAAVGGDPKTQAAVFLYRNFDTDTSKWKWYSRPPAIKTLTGVARSGDQFWVVDNDGNMRWTETNGKTWSKLNTPKQQGGTLNSILMMLPPKKKGPTLEKLTSPGDGTAGVSYLSLTASDLPDGAIKAENISVAFARECGENASSFTSAVSIVSGAGGSQILSFQLPSGLVPGQYFLSISDWDEGDANFESTNCATVNVVQ
jgi:photosystem II stability/assembly factor-like uncharacterized protein